MRRLTAVLPLCALFLLAGSGVALCAEAPDYQVKRGDTLLGIAQRHGLRLDELRELNSLPNDRIRPGQNLVVGYDHGRETTHVVAHGENLIKIARDHGTTVRELRRLNGLQGSRIKPGQALVLKATPEQIHIVQPGDALWEIAAAHDMSVLELKGLNGIQESTIHPGQELRVSRSATEAPKRARYKVRPGDSLGEIALVHRMSISELREWNGLGGSVIHPGQALEVRPQPGLQLVDAAKLDLSRLLQLKIAGINRLDAPNGPYFRRMPVAVRQESTNYSEKVPRSPLRAYREARQLWTAFEREVDQLGRTSRELEGWHIVLDPGHGGIDPGAIVPVVAGNGDQLHVVEDEYVYDIMLRVYTQLRLHGATVTPTLLSPTHLLRRNEPARVTFTHVRDEVYNLESINRPNSPSCWPKGGRTGLNRRVEVAKAAFKGVAKDRRLFISLHADNNPGTAKAAGILYYERPGHRDRSGMRLAKSMLPALGAGAYSKGRRLRVLRDNPADAAVLVELRNIHYSDHAWALRFEELRQRDAEKVALGLITHVRGAGTSAASR